jgi:hypothetical protein
MTADEIVAWFAGRLPDDWFLGPPDVRVDRDEILVLGDVAAPDLADDAGDDARRAARAARAKRFREETRDQRVAVAQEAERRFGRAVSWGVSVEGERHLFTHLAVPVMTRLRLAERQVLDTLIDGGVARSRSEALAWCVRLVEQHQGEWIAELRDALSHVERARASGPSV